MPLNNSGLGKSISDVLQNTPKSARAKKGYLSLPIDKISPPKKNPRKSFNEEALQELSASITKHGILQPLVVLKTTGGYEVLAGERRFRAAKLAGLIEVPVVIRDSLSDQENAELRLIENIQREDLNAIEVAQGYQELMTNHNLSQDELAERLGKSRSSISNSVRLLTLEQDILVALIENKISAGHAKVLCGIKESTDRKAAFKKLQEDSLSVRSLEEHIKSVDNDSSQIDKKTKPQKKATVRELEENLSQLLGHRITLNEKRKGGSLQIHYADRAELEEILDQLQSAL